MKKITVVLTCIILMAFFAGCSVGGSAFRDDTELASVNGEPITAADFNAFYSGRLADMGVTEEALTETYGGEEVAALKNDILSDLVAQELMMQYAKENGLDTISEEDRQSIKEDTQSTLDSIKQSIAQSIQQEGVGDGVFINDSAEVEKRYQGYLKENNMSEEIIEKQLERQMIFNRVYEDVMKGFELTDEYIREYYDESLKEQQEMEESDPEEALQMYLNNGFEVNLNAPESLKDSAKMIKHILITPSEAYSEEIEQANGDAEVIEEIVQRAKDETRAEAESIIDRLDAGEDFETLMEEYNMDPGVQTNPDGYLVYEGSNYVESFINEAMELKTVGEYSDEPVESEYGYHILLYASEPETGPVPFEEAEQLIRSAIESSRQYEYWTNELNKMRDSAEISQTDFTG